MKLVRLALVTLPFIIPLLSFPDSADDDCPCHEKKKKHVEDVVKEPSAIGYIYKGMTKQELETIGYTKHNLLMYHQEDAKEWMTFSDWATPEQGDAITFYLVDGQVKSWFKK